MEENVCINITIRTKHYNLKVKKWQILAELFFYVLECEGHASYRPIRIIDTILK